MVEIGDCVQAYDEYVICGVTADHALVEAWSGKRLPFEPTGTWLEMRNDLRRALGRLTLPHGQVLQAVYSSQDMSTCDAENVLLYNVGDRYFAASAHTGVRFERGFASPRESLMLPSHPPQHYHRYFAADHATTFHHRGRGRTLAHCTVALATRAQLCDASSVWYAVKSGKVGVESQAALKGATFGLSVSLRTPPGVTVNLASLAKPVFDGVVAAFQMHDGSNLKLLSERLAARLGQQPEEIAGLLMYERHNVLGKDRLLWARANGFQWIPADHHCVAGELLLDDRTTQQGWELSGTLFAVNQ